MVAQKWHWPLWSFTYTWNNLGEKTSMTVPMGFMGTNNARVYEYNYDMTGRQTGMNVSAASVTSNSTLATGSSGDIRFLYSATEDRVKLITKAGDVYYFVYGPTASVPAVVYEAVNDGGTATTYLNVRNPAGGLISREKYEGAIQIYSRTYHFDGLGSTVALTDENGEVTDTYTYDEWGNATHATGSTADNPYQYVGQLGYYTHYQEPTFDMLQLGVRYYDPSTGRFTQLDPINDGLNWYAYVGGNPMARIDPWGLTWAQNFKLLNDWLTGQGPTVRFYGGGSRQTGELWWSQGVQNARMQAAYDIRCGKKSSGNPIGWTTIQAAAELPHATPTAAQVGAYNVQWRLNPNGSITYKVQNKLSFNSFFYHIPEILNNMHIPVPAQWNQPAPMGNIWQIFMWTEPASNTGLPSNPNAMPDYGNMISGFYLYMKNR